MRRFLVLLSVIAFFSTALAVEKLKEVKFLAYNVENYVRMNRADPKTGLQTDSLKPESAIQALVSIIRSEKPDIIGVCEMGAPAEFQDFLTRLKEAGLDYPNTEYVQAMDVERHLALASRFPISSRNSQTNLSFEIDGKKQYFKRGILDVIIDLTPATAVHFLGTHLKSKRDVSNDQAILRRNEAHLLRLHTKSVLQKFPDTKLVVYGDLNDTINGAPIREIIGQRNSPHYLAPLNLQDARGDRWTHYWKSGDIYSRIDYVLTTQNLTRFIVRSKSHIASPDNWALASDHRPLIVVFAVP